MALTSVIIPTHDRPALLRRAVDSARRAGTEIEVVVVEDGSTGDTSAVCASFRDVIHVRLEIRRGVGHARAAGIAASSGTYTAFLDDDDARLPGSIDRQVAVLEANPEAALVYGQMHFATQSLSVDDEDRPFPEVCSTGDVFWRLIETNFIPSGSVVVRRSAVDAAGGLFPEVAPADDWDLWLRIAERHPVAALPEPVAIYRRPTLWSKQGSSRLADGLLPASFRALERCATLPRATADADRFRQAARNYERALCAGLLGEAFEAARRGDPYAFTSLRLALTVTPGAILPVLFSTENWKKLRKRL